MKDPAFLYYDGDAARDVSHMNRLERGCYFDLIQAQRKFNGFTVEQARKILGKDFEECWPAIELILECENDIFYIVWVRDSIDNRKKYNEKQKERIQNYWNNKNNPQNNHGNTVEVPLENENEIVDENEIIIKPESKKTKVIKSEVDPAFIICRDHYFKFYKSLTGKSPSFNGAQGANLKKLLPCIRQTMEEQGVDDTPENVLQSFDIILKNLPAWIKKGIDINIIYSKYDSIIAEIRTKSGANNAEVWQADVIERERRRASVASNG